MKIAIGCDHGGFHLKSVVVRDLEASRHIVRDCGAATLVPDDDYPDFIQSVGQAIQGGEAERGIAICGSGVGASIAANKMHGIRAAICHDTYSARQGVEDDNMNGLCLGGRIVGEALAVELVTAFLAANFSGEERHRRRLVKVATLESIQPWPLSFSFARAIQQPALELWQGEPSNVSPAQQMLLHRASCNSAARRGDYSAAMEVTGDQK